MLRTYCPNCRYFDGRVCLADSASVEGRLCSPTRPWGTNTDIETTFDNVNHPSHYTDGKIEVLDFIEAKKLSYHLGNVVKYICRAGKKSEDTRLEDLKKAQFYLNRAIEQEEQN